MLEPGAWAIGTETELVLKSRWVEPETLLAAGYACARSSPTVVARSALAP
jgi:NAD dependent epimerase/dehydratase family enzyme